MESINWDYTTDFLVVGSGAGMVGALQASKLGKEVLIIEKTDKVGGSTGLSGGILWLPNNPMMKKDGDKDSFEEALLYMETVIGEPGQVSTLERRKTYIEGSSQMLTFLENEGIEFRRCKGFPDYYAGVRGVKGYSTAGRSVEPKAFNINKLGEWKQRLRPGISEPLVMYLNESPWVSKPKTAKGFFTAARAVMRTVFSKVSGRKDVTCGAALAGRLLGAVLKRRIPIWVETELKDLIVQDDKVIGAVVLRNGQTLKVRANDGVLLASGGFSHNNQMREEFSSDQPGRSEWSVANPGDMGEPIKIAMKYGAATEYMNEAWWIPSWLSEGKIAMAVGERCKPGSIVVDQSGKRYFNEAVPYQEAGQLMFAHERNVGGALPSWLIIDARNRSHYTFGWLSPMITPKNVIQNGTLKRSNTLEGLAKECGINPANLIATVERFNKFAKAGADEDFYRGEGYHERFHGDHTHKPNPALGEISKAPFYAAALVPGDIGTNGGVITDECARVLNKSNQPIVGLYAAGNCTASVMGRKYPGAGATIGPAAVFSFVAANHAIKKKKW